MNKFANKKAVKRLYEDLQDRSGELRHEFTSLGAPGELLERINIPKRRRDELERRLENKGETQTMELLLEVICQHELVEELYLGLNDVQTNLADRLWSRYLENKDATVDNDQSKS